MDKLSLKNRINLVAAFYANNKSSIAALRAIKKERGLAHHLCNESTVRRLIKRFEETGSVTDLPKSGRPRISNEAVDEIAETVVDMQRTLPEGSVSAVKVAQKLDIPLSTVNKALKEYLSWRPYRIRIVQELKVDDSSKRLIFANWFLKKIKENPTFINTILWSDEAHFYTDGCACTHQCVIWAPNHPHAIIEKKMYPDRVTVWVGFTKDFVLEPFFFDSSITGEAYLKMLKESVIPQLKIKNALESTVFQQDGAPPHIYRPVKKLLEETFGSNIISRHFENNWPPRSPDIAPNDFWLWGMIKSQLWREETNNKDKLKDRIRRILSEIKLKELQKTMDHLILRLNMLISNNGHHFEHLIK